jgi:hypothetical protein
MINLVCDESHDQHTYALAGWACIPDGWDGISHEWQRMLLELNMPEFHAVEIVERDNIADSRFKGWTFEQEKVAFTRAVDVLVATHLCKNLVAIGCSVSLPKKQDEFGFESQDTIWVFLFCRLLAELIRDFPHDREFNLLFDEKKQIRDTVNAYYYQAKDLTERQLPGYFSGSAVAFANSEKKMPLQAADLFAYEWRKRISDRIRTPDKPPRRSYARLREKRKAYLHHIGRDIWLEAESKTKDPSKFMNLLLNSIGTEE